MSHTAMPILSDITAICTQMGVTLSTATFSTAYQQDVLDSVIDEVHRVTRRTFVLESETRYFDGNGKGLLIVDDFVTFDTATAVEVIGWIQNTSGIILTNVYPVVTDKFPQNKIQIIQGSVSQFPSLYLDQFPEGRSNIKITCTWGYANTIPADLWLGIAWKAAGIMINQTLFNTEGYLIKWQEGDVTEVTGYQNPFQFMGGNSVAKDPFKVLLTKYRKPRSHSIYRQEKPLF